MCSTDSDHPRSRPWLVVFVVVMGIALALGAVWWMTQPDGGRFGVDRSMPTGPNVVLIVLDTTRADYFSSYGFARETTPRMDALAADGVRFAHAFATDFWTLPSHASIFTGLYPRTAGATSVTNHLPADVETVAEMLQSAGYQTGGFSQNTWIGRERGFTQGFDSFVELWRPGASDPSAGPPDEPSAGTSAQLTDWIDRHADRPFFLFVNLDIAHLPYSPPKRLERKFMRHTLSPKRMARLRNIKGEWAYVAKSYTLDFGEISALRDLYAAEVAYADEIVGKVADDLSRTGVLDHTLFIITADHGENLGEHGLLGHPPCMFETVMHVPLILRYPPRIESNHVRDDLVSLIDIVPTILDVCDVNPVNNDVSLPGASLAAKSTSPNEFVYAENEQPINAVKVLRNNFPAFDADSLDHRLRMLRTDRYKIVWHEGRDVEFFDLESDPNETESIAASKPPELAELMGQLLELSESIVEHATVEPMQSKDAEALEHLRSLGYIE